MKVNELERFYGKQARIYDFTRKFFLFDRKAAVESLELKPENRVIDIACGTGINSIRFSKEGIKVIGIDSSLDMLKIAKNKVSSAQFFYGNFLNFNIPNNVDSAICFDFSTNYILTKKDFKNFLNRVYKCLNANGIFIFDFKPLASFAKEEKHLNKDFIFDWTCQISNSPIINIGIKIVTKDGGKFEERHVERGYKIDEIKNMIAETKFKLVRAYDNCLRTTPNDNSKLVQIVLRKL